MLVALRRHRSDRLSREPEVVIGRARTPVARARRLRPSEAGSTELIPGGQLPSLSIIINGYDIPVPGLG
jgi:hypothetical protein